MAGPDRQPRVSDELRRQAERLVAARSGERSTPEDRDLLELIHELEIRNEELRRAHLDLADERNRYFDLYDLAPVGYLTIDREGLITRANLTAATMLGVPRKNLVGGALSRFVDPGHFERWIDLKNQALETGESRAIELKLSRRDGRIARSGESGQPIFAWLATTVERDETGRPSRIQATISDMTERRRAEEELARHQTDLEDLVFERTAELRDTMARLQGIMDHSPALIFLKDTRGRFLLVNRRFEELHGISQEHARLRSHHDLWARQIAENFEQSDQAVLASGRPQTIYENMTIGGRKRQFVTTKFPLFDDRGEIIQICGIATEVSDLRTAERALAESEARYRMLAEHAADLIWVMDDKFRFTYVSPSCRSLLGYRPEEMIGLEVGRILTPADAERTVRLLKRALALGRKHPDRPAQFNLQLAESIRRDGSSCMTETRITMLGDQERPARGFLGVTRDVTGRVQSDRQIEEYQQQLRALTKELVKAEEQERRRITLELHDNVCQALAMANLKLSQLQSSRLSSSQQDKLDEAMQLVADSLRDTRSLISNVCPSTLYDLGLEAALRELAESMEAESGLAIEIRGGPIPFPLSEEQRSILYRAIRELLVNAVKHARADSVAVSIRPTTRELVIHVRDDGVGMDVRKALRGLSKKKAFGLFNVQERLRQLGGDYQLDSEIGRGTSVTLTLPIAAIRRGRDQDRPTEGRAGAGRTAGPGPRAARGG